MADRFYCPNLSGATASLDDSEAHHALHVMRVKPGQQIELFDGAGTTAQATVTKVGRRDVDAEIVSRAFQKRRVEGGVTIAAVPPKGDRLKWMVEKLTEVGIDRFVPLRSERAVVDPRQSKIEKLSHTVITASKQCGRDWLMEIADPAELSEFFETPSGGGEQVVMAHPGGSAFVPSTSALVEDNVTVLIGPEGGFTDDEVQRAKQNGIRLAAWSGPILRTETAAVVFAALVLANRDVD